MTWDPESFGTTATASNCMQWFKIEEASESKYKFEGYSLAGKFDLAYPCQDNFNTTLIGEVNHKHFNVKGVSVTVKIPCHKFDRFGIALYDTETAVDEKGEEVSCVGEAGGCTTGRSYQESTGPLYFGPDYQMSGEYRSIMEVTMGDDYGYDEDSDMLNMDPQYVTAMDEDSGIIKQYFVVLWFLAEITLSKLKIKSFELDEVKFLMRQYKACWYWEDNDYYEGQTVWEKARGIYDFNRGLEYDLFHNIITAEMTFKPEDVAPLGISATILMVVDKRFTFTDDGDPDPTSFRDHFGIVGKVHGEKPKDGSDPPPWSNLDKAAVEKNEALKAKDKKLQVEVTGVVKVSIPIAELGDVTIGAKVKVSNLGIETLPHVEARGEVMFGGGGFSFELHVSGWENTYEIAPGWNLVLPEKVGVKYLYESPPDDEDEDEEGGEGGCGAGNARASSSSFYHRSPRQQRGNGQNGRRGEESCGAHSHDDNHREMGHRQNQACHVQMHGTEIEAAAVHRLRTRDRLGQWR